MKGTGQGTQSYVSSYAKQCIDLRPFRQRTPGEVVGPKGPWRLINRAILTPSIPVRKVIRRDATRGLCDAARSSQLFLLSLSIHYSPLRCRSSPPPLFSHYITTILRLFTRLPQYLLLPPRPRKGYFPSTRFLHFLAIHLPHLRKAVTAVSHLSSFP